MLWNLPDAFWGGGGNPPVGEGRPGPDRRRVRPHRRRPARNDCGTGSPPPHKPRRREFSVPPGNRRHRPSPTASLPRCGKRGRATLSRTARKTDWNGAFSPHDAESERGIVSAPPRKTNRERAQGRTALTCPHPGYALLNEENCLRPRRTQTGTTPNRPQISHERPFEREWGKLFFRKVPSPLPRRTLSGGYGRCRKRINSRYCWR